MLKDTLIMKEILRKDIYLPHKLFQLFINKVM